MTQEDAFREAFGYLRRYEIYRLFRTLAVLITLFGLGFYLTSWGVMIPLERYLRILAFRLELPCTQFADFCEIEARLTVLNVQLIIFLILTVGLIVFVVPTVLSINKTTSKSHEILSHRLGVIISVILYFTTFQNLICEQLMWRLVFFMSEVWRIDSPLSWLRPFFTSPLFSQVSSIVGGFLWISFIILPALFLPMVGVAVTLRLLRNAHPKSDFSALRMLRNTLIILCFVDIGTRVASLLISGPLWVIIYQAPQIMQFIQEYLWLIIYCVMFAVALSFYLLTGWQLLKRAEQVLETPHSKKGLDSEGFDESGEPLPEW